jgi:hypothetical protein
MRHRAAVAGLVLSILVLIPGLFLNVITVRGLLSPEGLAALAPQLLEEGLSEDAVKSLRPLLNPAMLPFLEMSPGGLRGALITNLGGQLGEQLKGAPEIEVYHQTRSIVGSIRHLYSVNSYVAASLILLFAVIVPFTKASLAVWAVQHRDDAIRQRTLLTVEAIAKWSMADVFAIALFITYLAAQASQTSLDPASAAPIMRFQADFGPGFYWFAAYCVFSLAVQQWITRWLSVARTRVVGA